MCSCGVEFKLPCWHPAAVFIVQSPGHWEEMTWRCQRRPELSWPWALLAGLPSLAGRGLRTQSRAFSVHTLTQGEKRGRAARGAQELVVGVAFSSTERMLISLPNLPPSCLSVHTPTFLITSRASMSTPPGGHRQAPCLSAPHSCASHGQEEWRAGPWLPSRPQNHRGANTWTQRKQSHVWLGLRILAFSSRLWARDAGVSFLTWLHNLWAFLGGNGSQRQRAKVANGTLEMGTQSSWAGRWKLGTSC